jgi:hypothetical protein
MLRYSFMFLALLLASTAVQASPFTQRIRGTVWDQDNHQALFGANIVVSNTNPMIGASTNAEGEFVLENVPLGRVEITISYLGYHSRKISNILVTSAKEVLLEVYLKESSTLIEGVVIKPDDDRGAAINDIAVVSSRSISVEETSRYAGGFNDPSRITSNFAGVSNTQDGSNDIIIRGNSPKYVQWRLEGVHITNPNHFADQNAVSGVISALNNNLLATSDFYTGAFPAEFGDALSGVYDVKLRKGNNRKSEGIFSLGTLGTDITLEGPFSKNYNGSYLVNYRYSTLGLVSDLGMVDDINGTLNYQDAAFKLWLPAGKFGAFSVFGLGGTSNFYYKDVDPGLWVTPGDNGMRDNISEDYDKGAQLLNTGVRHIITLNKKSYLNTSVLIASEGIQDDIYENESQLDSIVSRQLNFKSDLKKTTIRAISILNHKINAKHQLRFGLAYSTFNYQLDQSQSDKNDDRVSLFDFDETIRTFRTFINWKYSVSPSFLIVAGVHNMNVLYNSKHAIEPRLAVKYTRSATDNFSIGYGLHSTMESVPHYFTKANSGDGIEEYVNQDLGLLKAHHLVGAYERRLNTQLRLKLEAYYQWLYDLPVENSTQSSFATINEGLEFNYVDLVNEGRGENCGIEITLEHFLNKGFYYLFNATAFHSIYTALDGVTRNTGFNSDYLINILIGKEFSGWGKNSNQTFAINAKVFLGGGRYIIPLLRDEEGELAVDPENGLYYDFDKAYQTKLDDIHNITLNFSYKWNKPKSTHELFLGLDNMKFNEARLWEYYDSSEPDNIGYQKQILFFPNFLYRVYF